MVHRPAVTKDMLIAPLEHCAEWALGMLALFTDMCHLSHCRQRSVDQVTDILTTPSTP